MKARGSSWDGSPAHKDHYARQQVEERGSAWDNAVDWNHSEDLDGGTPMPAVRKSTRWILRRWVAAPFSSSAALDPHDGLVGDGGKPTPLSGKVRPEGTCITCLVKRWVSSPYISAVDTSAGGGKGQDGGKPQPLGNEELRVKRTEDSKGGVSQTEGKGSSDGGKPTPLCTTCWYRRAKRCVWLAKESGWNHGVACLAQR